jgi:hypothetical protein
MSKILGDYIGFKESLEDEFKEFMFKITPEFYFSQTQISSYVKTGILDEKIFNDFVFENLTQYLQIYLPKYISAFGNSEEVNDGYLYIGVNNSGELTGIPFLGEINQSDIEKIIHSTKDWVGIENDTENKFRDELVKNITFELIPLDADMDLLEDDEEELTKLETAYHNYVSKYKEFIIERDKWLEELQSFTNKISYIILDKTIRSEIANYIRENCEKDRFWIADFLDSEETIEILNGIQLVDYKNDDNNIYYWIMFYKDYIVDKIRKKKPVKPQYVYGNLENVYLDYFRGLTKLRRKFIKNNLKLTYTVLKFRIPGKDKKSENLILYSPPGFVETWFYKIRTIGIQGPCCI